MMGFEGNCNMGVDFGGKKNYKRMTSELEGEDEGCRANNSRSSSRYVMVCAFFASLNSVLLGYDVGVMSGAILFIQEDLNITEVQQETLVGILSIVSLIGSLFGGKSSDVIGRKWTMAIGAVVFQIGGIIMTIAPTFTMLMIGRLLSGIGIGFGATIMGVYIAEIAPASSRGFLTSFPDLFINLGILLGYVSNYAFSGLPSHINWRVMLALGVLPSVIIAFALFIIPESPRWLVMQGRIEEAKLILMKTIGDKEEVDERLGEIQQAAVKTTEENAVWYELLRPTPKVARMLLVGIGIQCFQQITGIDSLIYYSPTIFKAAGVEDKTKLLAATVAVGVTKTAFIPVTLFLIDKKGRKPLLYVSTMGMTACLFCIAVIMPLVGAGPVGIAVAVLAVCGDVAFFSVGMGPICWVLNSEIFPLRLRAQAAALGAVGNRLCSGLVSLSFLSVTRAITVPGTFFIFFAFSAASVAFVHVYVPETKGKTLEQIETMFQAKQAWEESEVELGDNELLVEKH